MTDAEVVANLERQHDVERTIRFLYQTHFESLGRFVVNNSGSWDDAQDTFQEVIVSFIHLVQQRKFRGEASIKTFLYSLNKNIWLNELKRRGRAMQREKKYQHNTEPENPGINAALEYREAEKELVNVLDQLGESCKRILLLFYYENRSMREIVDVIHYENEQVVRNKKYKCLKKLEELITANANLQNRLKNLFA
ncbi:MAG: sigma-70 family RNA polymerase sigma factor [Chitinophagaceae bacterium]|nr:sigma-70 family RNA polymerase sigma factor [Chitinophagaceae bacterium]